MSGVTHIVEATRPARGVAEAAIAEATYVQSQGKSWIGTLAESTKATASHAVGEMSQGLEHGLEAVASGSIMASVQTTQAVVEGLCR